MAAASETKIVPVEEWLTFLTTHKFKKNLQDFEEVYSYRKNHLSEFPKRKDYESGVTTNSDYLILTPVPTNIHQFYGFITSIYTTTAYGVIPISFVLTYEPVTNRLTYQSMKYGFYDKRTATGPRPIPTPKPDKQEVTIPELLEIINNTKQIYIGGAARRRSRKAKKNKALSPK